MTRFLFLLAACMSFACGNSAPTGGFESTVYETENKAVKFRVETVATGLEVPWGFAWLPAGDMLVTERRGRVRLIEGGKLLTEPVFAPPDVEPSGESGLMDITLHPAFASNNFVYLAYSYNSDGRRVKVVRYAYKDRTFAEPRVIIDNIPGLRITRACGTRFGPDGKLYVTTGDSTEWDLAQKLNSLAGKTLRLNDDGSVPTDNPFVGRTDARPEIFSYGHRNAQGLAWQPGSGLMFQTEHGPSFFEGKGSGGDEVNFVERGANLGWPEIHHASTREGMVAPLLEYSPACAPGSGMFYSADAFPELKGNFFFGCLKSARIIRVVLDGRKVVSQENLFTDVFGRIRDVEQGPDGFIYFSTSNRDGRGSPGKDDDRIMRLVPVK